MHFGIDLGTTNSLISVFENGQARLIGGEAPLFPSVVSVLDCALVVGPVAKERLVAHPEATVAAFKRAMGTQKSFRLGKTSLSAPDLSALVLRALRERAEAELGVPVRDVVISVPAYFNQIQRRAVRQAALSADLNPIRLVNEPTAAALAYGLQDIDGEGHILVFDLGGGTFDVSIVEIFERVIEVKATSGDAYLGGEDFTEALVAHFIDTLGLRALSSEERAQLWGACEALKHQLSTAHAARCSFHPRKGEVELAITREGFAEVVSPLVQRLRLPVERALYDAKLGREQIDRVVLVGGATRMPVVRALVARLLGKLPEAGLDPDLVVALGAATQAALIARDAAFDDVMMTDVSAFSLGFEVARRQGNTQISGYFQPVIERNTVIPVSREHRFSPANERQKMVKLALYQGEAPLVKDNIALGHLEVRLPPGASVNEQISVRLSYDTSGLIEVDARVLSSGLQTSLVIEALAGEMSAAEREARRKALAALKVHPRDEEANIALMARIERWYAMARGGDRDWLQAMLAAFQDLLEGQNLSDIAQARTAISADLDAFEARYVR
ncbi:Hsp70 family protein [Rhodobacter maris]|nr:Hsp70 family protein [Rhodobacter maris]